MQHRPEKGGNTTMQDPTNPNGERTTFLESVRDAGHHPQAEESLEEIQRQFEDTVPEDPMLIPAGEYFAAVSGGEFYRTPRKRTPAYRVEFRLLLDEGLSRGLYHLFFLTPRALPMAKRDLSKLGVSDVTKPVPPVIRCRARVGTRTLDDGRQVNAILYFERLPDADAESDPFLNPPPPDMSLLDEEFPHELADTLDG